MKIAEVLRQKAALEMALKLPIVYWQKGLIALW